MKKIKLLFMIGLLGLSLTACDDKPVENPNNQQTPEEIKYTVKFNSMGGTVVSSQKIVENNKATKPNDPVFNGHTFLGWYLNEEEFDFNTLITSNITLVAKWEKINTSGDTGGSTGGTTGGDTGGSTGGTTGGDTGGSTGGNTGGDTGGSTGGTTGGDTDIDLSNDAYYKNVDLTLSGQDFIDDLTVLINTNYTPHSYTYNNTVLKESDKDPENPNNIICLYTGQSLSTGAWNKEHVWAKSHGFPGESTQAYRDAHHLRPTLNLINSTRGNLDFGNVEDYSASYSSDTYGNKWSSVCFEPRDEVKGDVARMMFYMVTKYNNIDGTKLTLVDTIPTSTSSGNGKFGCFSTLLEWHYLDPVDDFERNRNEVVYSYQKNRNPYIDYPEFVDIAFLEDESTNQTNIDNVISKIDALPSISELTLEDESKINECIALYEALSTAEKSKVTNYEELVSLVNKLDELKEENDDSNIDSSLTTAISINFKELGLSGTSSYQTEQTIAASGNNYYFSNFYVGAGEVRLGSNKEASLDTKFGVTGKDGSYLEALYDVENLKAIRIQIDNTYGTSTEQITWQIYFTPQNESTYELISSGKFTSQGSYEVTATLDTQASGHFTFVIYGTKPRVAISEYELFTE